MNGVNVLTSHFLIFAEIKLLDAILARLCQELKSLLLSDLKSFLIL